MTFVNYLKMVMEQYIINMGRNCTRMSTRLGLRPMKTDTNILYTSSICIYCYDLAHSPLLQINEGIFFQCFRIRSYEFKINILCERTVNHDILGLLQKMPGMYNRFQMSCYVKPLCIITEKGTTGK